MSSSSNTATAPQPIVREVEHAARKEVVERLSNEIYDCYLREAGGNADLIDWYQTAFQVAERFKQLLQDSCARNQVPLFKVQGLDRSVS